MPTVAALKRSIKSHRKKACPPYSHLKKPGLMRMAKKLGVKTTKAAPKSKKMTTAERRKRFASARSADRRANVAYFAGRRR